MPRHHLTISNSELNATDRSRAHKVGHRTAIPTSDVPQFNTPIIAGGCNLIGRLGETKAVHARFVVDREFFSGWPHRVDVQLVKIVTSRHDLSTTREADLCHL